MKKIQIIINVLIFIIFVILYLTNRNYNKFHTQVIENLKTQSEFHTQVTENLKTQLEINDKVIKINDNILKILSNRRTK